MCLCPATHTLITPWARAGPTVTLSLLGDGAGALDWRVTASWNVAALLGLGW